MSAVPTISLALPPFKSDLVVDGYHFDMAPHLQIHAIDAQFLKVEVTDAHGHKPTFVPWFGALAHAIFFRQGTLDYFHTHICAPNAPNCGVLAGVPSSRISGSSAAPGKLTIGVLLPEARDVAPVPADEARRTDRDRAIHAAGRVMRPAGIRLRLFAAVAALAAGVAAVIIAIALVQSALG